MKIIDPSLIIEAYSQGYFPMGKEGSETEVEWYSARKRGVFPLENFHLPDRVKRRIRSKAYYCRVNAAFDEVLIGCANRESTWINQTIHDTFMYLHEIHIAHSVEVWRENKLCGGLYGIAIGGAFFAESVFQNEPECMKMALGFCHERLIKKGFTLWDVQFANPFLMQFGCREINPANYMKRLEAALSLDVYFDR